MKSFRKKLHIGETSLFETIKCEIEYIDGRLSIYGNEGRECFGQIVFHEWNLRKYGYGWDAALVEQFRNYWKRWNLNDLRAVTVEQMDAIREGKRTGELKDNASYDDACAFLKSKGLYQVEHNGKEYKYGHAWLYEAVPDSVLEFFSTLPEEETVSV
jgi:hypothetical protein